MNAEGTTLIAGALVLSGLGAVAWLAAGRAGVPRAVRLGRHSVIGAAVAVLGALVLMQVALLGHDVSNAYVARVSGPELPVYYRITALWSAVEGSVLLWLGTLCAVLVLALRFVREGGAHAQRVAVAVLCLVVAAFALTSLIASPFAPAEAATGGRPNPLLQDHVAMGMHPPLLYAGFAGLAVPYALTIGALVARSVDRQWANRVRAWNLAAWVLLTAGIVLGAWWSYAVLGWGGYWAWDPVENASLMPWLTSTALLHAVGPRTRVGHWRLWAAGLAGAGFVLVLLANFLTRSGVVESIHAFSVSPLGPLLLAIVVTALLPWVGLMITRRQDLATTPGPPGRLDLGTAVSINHVLFVIITAIVFVGTLLPTVILSLTGDRVSVGPPWYHRTLAPVALVLLVVMAVAPWLRRKHENPGVLARRMAVPALAGATAIGVVGVAGNDVWLALTAAIAVFAMASLVVTIVGSGTGRSGRRGVDRRRIGALLAHAGVAGGAVAVLAGGYATTSEVALERGDTLVAEETSVTFVDLSVWDEGRRSVVQAELVLGEQEEYLGTVYPQLRWYESDATMLAGPQIRSEPFRDVYVTLLDYEPEEGLATIRLSLNPLASWMWAAAAVIAVGGVVSLWPHKPFRRARSGTGIGQESTVRAGADQGQIAVGANTAAVHRRRAGGSATQDPTQEAVEVKR